MGLKLDLVEGFSVRVSVTLKVILLEEPLSSILMIWHVSKGMTWIDKCVLHVDWSHPTSKMISIMLHSLAHRGLEDALDTLIKFLITKWLERVHMLHYKLIMFWHWLSGPVAWFDDAVRWVSKMIDSILKIVGLIESCAL